MTAITTLNRRQQMSPCLNTCRAFTKSLAPIKWATCTEKPMDAEAVMLPNNQVVLSTKPIDADGLVPKCPTIDASMKNISTVVIWARIDGILNCTIKLSFSPFVMLLPSRMLASSASVLVVENISFNSVTKIEQAEDKGNLFALLRRSLSYAKIAQAECKESLLALLRRSLSFAKVRIIICFG